eukprot:3535598-Amphidinium_carterae.1
MGTQVAEGVEVPQALQWQSVAMPNPTGQKFRVSNGPLLAYSMLLCWEYFQASTSRVKDMWS